jgi:hypothetical protein
VKKNSHWTFLLLIASFLVVTAWSQPGTTPLLQPAQSSTVNNQNTLFVIKKLNFRGRNEHPSRDFIRGRIIGMSANQSGERAFL